MNPTFTGIVEDMPIEEYHAHPHLSNSGISALLRSPAHYKALSWSESKALRIGSAVHALLLEPEKAAQLLPVAPDVNKRTNAGKEVFAAWERSLRADAVILQGDEREIAENCAEAVRTNRLVQVLGLLDKAKAQHELSLFCEIKTDAGSCFARARYDILATGIHTGFDIKTTEDAGHKAFARSVEKFGYYRQAALYMRVARTLGIEIEDDGFVFIAVEKSAPFGVQVYTLDDQAIEQGDREVMRAAELWAKCNSANEWPSYEPKINCISLGPWALDAE